MRILGLSAFHRDSAAVLLEDGQPVAAAQEERFSRKRLDSGFPNRSIRFCLQKAGIRGSELDRVVFFEKPLRKFERLLATQLRAFPRSTSPFSKIMFLWLGDRLWMKNRIANETGVPAERVLFTEHHRAHAASAFFPSPFDEAAILTVDDGGEWATTTLGRGEGSALQVSKEIHFPHSLGLFASAITQFLGFEPGAEEDRVEALSRHGQPRFAEALGALARMEEGGGFSIDSKPFRFSFDPDRLYDQGLEEILGPARFPGTPLRNSGDDTRDADVAASVQAVLEERVLSLARELHEETPSENLCFAGALARNRGLVARLLADGPFARLYIPPAPEDAGAALGAALWVHCVALGGERVQGVDDLALGEAIDDRSEEGARELGGNGAASDEVLTRLLDGQVVAWTKGALEFGPESLSGRSLFVDPRAEDARSRLLGAVQKTESWLPCRVVVPAERASEFFELPDGAPRALRLAQLSTPATDALREAAPSAVEPDGRAWPQIVDAETDPELYGLLERFGDKTGVPLLLHTTFSLRGAPVVRSEADAVDAFQRSSLDVLVSGTRVYERE